MDCAAILFDLDGVLIDSTGCVERHWRTWAQKHGLEAEDILRKAHGVRNLDTMRLLAPYLDVEREAAQFAADEVADTEGVAAIAGASRLLAGLDGVAWAIVTSCGAALARARLLAAHLPVPHLLISGDDVVVGKPEPGPYLLAAQRLGVDPESCVVVEDTPAGIQAGKHAGMRVVGIAFTYGRDDLHTSGADFILDRLTGLEVQKADHGRALISLHVP
jgi:sugar-phosphatase